MKIDTWETAVLHTKGVQNDGMPPFCPHHDADWTASVHLERATKTHCIVFFLLFPIFAWCHIHFGSFHVAIPSIMPHEMWC